MTVPKEPLGSAAEITGTIEGLAAKVAELERRTARAPRRQLTAPVVATRWRMIAVISCCVVVCTLLAWLGLLAFTSPWVW